jgi:hypothetical protein
MAFDRDNYFWTYVVNALQHYQNGSWVQQAIPDGITQKYGNATGPVSVDTTGTVWLTTACGLYSYLSGNWAVHPYAEVDLSNNRCAQGMVAGRAMPAPDGSIWMHVSANYMTPGFYGLARLEKGVWTTYSAEAIGLIEGQDIFSLAFESNGSAWGIVSNTDGPSQTLAHFDGNGWKLVNIQTSDDRTGNIAVDNKDTLWVSYARGLLSYNGSTWRQYPLPDELLSSIYRVIVDKNDVKWMIAENAIITFDGHDWQRIENLVPSMDFQYLDLDPDGHIWYVKFPIGPSIQKFYAGGTYPIENGRWLDDRTWQGSFAFNSTIARGPKALSILDADGFPLAPAGRFSFTVDYAAQVSDRSPPTRPLIYATGVSGDSSVLQLEWLSADLDTPIVAMRYAVGSSAGGSDIVNWTVVPVSAQSSNAALSSLSQSQIERGQLNLTPGQRYWVAVQVQNAGGLWSEIAESSFVAGEVSPRPAAPSLVSYLPFVSGP